MPVQVIRRRFWKSLMNFDRVYRPVATTWRLYDGGSLAGRPLIAHGTGTDEPTIADPTKWKEIRQRIVELT